MDGQPKKHNGSYNGWSCKNLAVRSQSLPPSGIQREYQDTQEGVAMCGLPAVMLSSMKTPSAVQTEQYSYTDLPRQNHELSDQNKNVICW